MLGGPSFEDMIADAAAGNLPAAGAPPPPQHARDNPGDEFVEEGPTEIFGEISEVAEQPVATPAAGAPAVVVSPSARRPPTLDHRTPPPGRGTQNMPAMQQRTPPPPPVSRPEDATISPLGMPAGFVPPPSAQQQQLAAHPGQRRRRRRRRRPQQQRQDVARHGGAGVAAAAAAHRARPGGRSAGGVRRSTRGDARAGLPVAGSVPAGEPSATPEPWSAGRRGVRGERRAVRRSEPGPAVSGAVSGPAAASRTRGSTPASSRRTRGSTPASRARGSRTRTRNSRTAIPSTASTRACPATARRRAPRPST